MPETESPNFEPVAERRPRSVEERREDRQLEIVKQRHSMAVAGFKIEQIFAEEVPAGEISVKSTESIFALKKRAKEEVERIEKMQLDRKGSLTETEKEKYVKFRQAAVDYMVKKLIANRQENELLKKLRENDLPETPESLGQYLFELRTGKEPTDLITATKKEAYFIIIFSAIEDFTAFYYGKQDGGPNEAGKNALLTGHAGGYCHEIKLPEFDNIAAVLVNGTLTSAEWQKKMIVTHERQHFINDAVFDKFASLELKGDAWEQDTEALRWVKDETLARIREGRTRDDCTNFLKETIYDYLRNQFSSAEKLNDAYVLLKKIRDTLGGGINNNDYVFMEDDERAVLVNHLVDIPLSRFPEWLPVILKYHAKLHDDLVGWRTLLNYDRKYFKTIPPGKEKIALEFEWLRNEIMTELKKVGPAVFLTDENDPQYLKTLELKKDYQELREQLVKSDEVGA